MQQQRINYVPFTPEEWDVIFIDNEFVYDRGLYMVPSQLRCRFEGIEIKLDPALYELLLIFAKNPFEYITLDKIKESRKNELLPDTVKSYTNRINRTFKEGMNIKNPRNKKDKEHCILKNQSKIGYKLNTKLIPANLIKII